MTDIIENNGALDNSATEVEQQATTPEVVESSTSTESTNTEKAVDTKPAKAKSLREVIEESYDKTTKPDSEAKKTALPAQEAPAPAAAEQTADKPIDPISGRALEPIKPPAGMPAAMREKWGSLDRQVQQYWTDRERDIQQTLSKTDVERKLASEFKEVAAPYESMLRQFNTTATAHAKELFNLSYTLNNGSPQTKAQVLYNLITHFKPDPATLQQLFAGQQPTVQPTEPTPPVDVQAEVQKALEARQAAEEEARVQAAVTAFAQDPAHEFYADVAPLMGKIIDAELVTGNDYTELFKNAYELACQRTPDIKAILDSRAAQAAQQTALNTPTSAQTSKPVPQVKPSLNGGGRSKVPTKPMTTREAAEAAYEKLMGKGN